MTPTEYEQHRQSHADQVAAQIAKRDREEAWAKEPVPVFAGRPVLGSGSPAAYESIAQAARMNKTHIPCIERSMRDGRLVAGQVWCYATPELLRQLIDRRFPVPTLMQAITCERARQQQWRERTGLNLAPRLMAGGRSSGRGRSGRAVAKRITRIPA